MHGSQSPGAFSSTPMQKRQRSWQEHPLPALLYRLSLAGIRIEFFLLTREGASAAVAAMPLAPGLSAGFVGAEIIPELARLRPDVEVGKWEDRFRRGLLCYAVKEAGRLVANTWCDLEEARHPPVTRKLGPREAYLLDAFTDPAFRGRNLAPAMRLGCYEALRAIGRDTFFSYTNYFNTPSRRFKQKIGAFDENLSLHLTLFGRFSRAFTLKRYAIPDLPVGGERP